MWLRAWNSLDWLYISSLNSDFGTVFIDFGYFQLCCYVISEALPDIWYLLNSVDQTWTFNMKHSAPGRKLNDREADYSRSNGSGDNKSHDLSFMPQMFTWTQGQTDWILVVKGQWSSEFKVSDSNQGLVQNKKTFE